jgi:hypothetical protein
MNNTIASIEAILVKVVNAGLFENEPNTYPIMNTIQVANRILIKMIPKNIMIIFK